MKPTKQIVNVRLTPEQCQRIHKHVKHSSILDQSKFIRLAVDWLLLACEQGDLGNVIETLESR